MKPPSVPDQLVPEPDVGEGAADHHLVVAAPRAVGVEVPRLDALLDQVAPGGAVLLDRPGGRDVVGGDRVAEQRQHPRAVDRLDARRARPASPRRRAAPDVGRVGPGVAVALGHLDRIPGLVALEDLAVVAGEHLRGDRLADHLLDLARVGPDVAQVDRLAVGALAERLGGQVDVHPPGQRVGDDQRRAGEVVRLHVLVDPALEVTVAGQHRADRQVLLLDRRRDLGRQRPGVADAGRAAVADQVELRAGRGTRSARPCSR